MIWFFINIEQSYSWGGSQKVGGLLLCSSLARPLLFFFFFFFNFVSRTTILRKFDNVMLRDEARVVPSFFVGTPRSPRASSRSLRTRHFVYVFTYFFPKCFVATKIPLYFYSLSIFLFKWKSYNFISAFFIRVIYVHGHITTLSFKNKCKKFDFQELFSRKNAQYKILK